MILQAEIGVLEQKSYEQFVRIKAAYQIEKNPILGRFERRAR